MDLGVDGGDYKIALLVSRVHAATKACSSTRPGREYVFRTPRTCKVHIQERERERQAPILALYINSDQCVANVIDPYVYLGSVIQDDDCIEKETSFTEYLQVGLLFCQPAALFVRCCDASVLPYFMGCAVRRGLSVSQTSKRYPSFYHRFSSRTHSTCAV